MANSRPERFDNNEAIRQALASSGNDGDLAPDLKRLVSGYAQDGANKFMEKFPLGVHDTLSVITGVVSVRGDDGIAREVIFTNRMLGCEVAEIVTGLTPDRQVEVAATIGYLLGLQAGAQANESPGV